MMEVEGVEIIKVLNGYIVRVNAIKDGEYANQRAVVFGLDNWEGIANVLEFMFTNKVHSSTDDKELLSDRRRISLRSQIQKQGE